jgi:hypothetical protein
MHLLEDVARHVRHGARSLWRSPSFSIAVILTLAIGIGGNTAVFSRTRAADRALLERAPEKLRKLGRLRPLKNAVGLA